MTFSSLILWLKYVEIDGKLYSEQKNQNYWKVTLLQNELFINADRTFYQPSKILFKINKPLEVNVPFYFNAS